LNPLTEKCPKSLTLINGEPFLAYQLSLLKSNGVSQVVMCVGHFGEQIAEYVKWNSFGLDITCSYDGPVALGTAGAVVKALPLLGSLFFTLYGDSYLDCDYAKVERVFLHQCFCKKGLMTAYQGVDYGFSAFRNDAFDGVTEGSLNKVHQHLLSCGELAVLEMERPFQEIGSPAGIEKLSNVLHSTILI